MILSLADRLILAALLLLLALFLVRLALQWKTQQQVRRLVKLQAAAILGSESA